MGSFLDVALRNAARGFRVIPLNGKSGFLKGWPDLATTDESAIREWFVRYPDNNVGVAGGEDFIILDTDNETRLLELVGYPAWFQTMKVSSGQPERAHYYYRATPDAVAFGSPSWAESKETPNIFELKGRGKLATAEGSKHPSGSTYAVVQDLPIIPFPAGLLARLRELKGATRATVRTTTPGDFTIEELLELVENNGVVIRSEPENIGDDWTIEIVCPWDGEHGSKRSKGDTTVGVINGRPTFSCLHGHCGDRHWKEFEEKVSPAPKVVISSTPEQPEPAAVATPNRPAYPDDAWADTVVSEYAELCTADNNVPKKLYIEAFRTVLGAVVGERLYSNIDGVTPRSYTVLIAAPGQGKGTAISRATAFFDEYASGSSGFKLKDSGVGAWLRTFSSVPGLSNICRQPLPKKPKEGEPVITPVWWEPMPRILSVHEEAKTFLSALTIKGGVGSATEGVVCQLWDREEFNGAATNERSAEYGDAQLSLLLGVTPEDWENITSDGDIVGGGLFSRLNIIGVERDYGNVDTMFVPDWVDLQVSFLPRIRRLINDPACIPASNEAKNAVKTWFESVGRPARANIQVWRTALLLAWLRQEQLISERSAADACRLGDFQLAMREWYRPTPADNPVAKLQVLIMKRLKSGAQTRRELQRSIYLAKFGTEQFKRALAGLIDERIVGKRERDSAPHHLLCPRTAVTLELYLAE